jgi:hypothetical protein
MVTDAFKPDQVPGASAPIGAGPVMAASPDAPGTAAPPPSPQAAGVDSGLGGLY